jgi:hypothetical protein
MTSTTQRPPVLDAAAELGRRMALRAIISEALRLMTDDDYPIVRFDLAHAHTVLGYPSDREASAALLRRLANA